MINIWNVDHSKRRKLDKFDQAREDALSQMGINTDSLEEAERLVLRKDGGECRNYGGLLVSGMAQALTIVIISVGIIFLLSILI